MAMSRLPLVAGAHIEPMTVPGEAASCGAADVAAKAAPWAKGNDAIASDMRDLIDSLPSELTARSAG